jgi:hypothetical protein
MLRNDATLLAALLETNPPKTQSSPMCLGRIMPGSSKVLQNVPLGLWTDHFKSYVMRKLIMFIVCQASLRQNSFRGFDRRAFDQRQYIQLLTIVKELPALDMCKLLLH